MTVINIVHLYAKEMNIYGDNGNILVLKKRLEWRGFKVKIHRIGVGDILPKDTHLIVGGGGQDKGQSIIADDLKSKSSILNDLAKRGVPMLMICGMYQMLGHYFKTSEGVKIPGIGLLDVHTIAGKGRLIGNITVHSEKFGELVGYENHSGLTYLGESAKAIGNTKKMQGNNGKDNTEGAAQYNVFGTYLHGPVLAKAPKFADYLLDLALLVADSKETLKVLDDTLENRAAQIAGNRPR